MATTYARKPRAPYTHDINTPTPSERIANNLSPLARGLSPRTLEVLAPGGVSPSALGPLPHPTWREVDDPEVVDGVPEADGVHTATRKHMAYMPLELFDDLDYEAASPEEWVALGAEEGVSAAPGPDPGPAVCSGLWPLFVSLLRLCGEFSVIAGMVLKPDS